MAKDSQSFKIIIVPKGKKISGKFINENPSCSLGKYALLCTNILGGNICSCPIYFISEKEFLESSPKKEELKEDRLKLDKNFLFGNL